MAEFFDEIKPEHQAFIEEQPMFFIATACSEGRINLSPKGMDLFRVLGSNEFAYLDMIGSGNETSTHIKHDGRVTVMFNSFTRRALILRLYGTGRVVRPNHDDFDDLSAHFPEVHGTRQIIVIKVDSVQTSCGYAVPVMDMVGERETLKKYAKQKSDQEIIDYQKLKNEVSIDGLDTGLND